MNQTPRSKMSKKVVPRDAKDNFKSKWVKRGETANKKEGGCGGIAHLTEIEKWEATKAEWVRIAQGVKKYERLSLSQRKPTILKSLMPDLPHCKSMQRLGRKKQKSSFSHNGKNVNPLEKSTLRMQEKGESDSTFSEPLERTEGKPSNENLNADESSSVKLMDWDNVKEAKLKSKEKELKKKLLTSSSTELKLNELKLIDELLSVRGEMTAIRNQAG